MTRHVALQHVEKAIGFALERSSLLSSRGPRRREEGGQGTHCWLQERLGVVLVNVQVVVLGSVRLRRVMLRVWGGIGGLLHYVRCG
jgi:hypothetical protein